MYINRGKHSLDDKNRLIIPKESILKSDKEIVLVEENNLTFSLYDIDKYNEKEAELIMKKSKAIDDGNNEVVEYLDAQLNLLEINILSRQQMNSDNRITILKNIKEMYEIEKSVILCNGYKHIKVFRDEEKFDEYRKKLINTISMRQQ